MKGERALRHNETGVSNPDPVGLELALCVKRSSKGRARAAREGLRILCGARSCFTPPAEDRVARRKFRKLKRKAKRRLARWDQAPDTWTIAMEILDLARRAAWRRFWTERAERPANQVGT